MKNDELLISELDTKKRRVSESEEKLSMTRELKFKELQEKIDDEEDNRITIPHITFVVNPLITDAIIKKLLELHFIW